MFRKEIKSVTRDDGKKIKLIIYSSENMQAFADGLKSLPANPESHVHENDLFESDDWSDPWSTGGHTKEEIHGMIRHGSDNTELTQKIKLYIDDVNNTAKVEKYKTIEYRPFGCAVCVPRALSGNPNCMILPKKQAVKTRIINLVVDSGVSGGISESKYKALGSVMARAIYDMERSGFRVRLTVVDTTDNHQSSNKTILVSKITLKDEREPMNLARILYPLTEPSFPRRVGFTLISRAPEWDDCWSLGVMSGPESLKKKIYNTVIGTNAIGLTFDTMCDMISNKGDRKDVQKIIEYIFEKLEENEHDNTP